MRFHRRESPELDLTSLIDVMFNLILFLVLSASFVQGAIPVSLPEGRGSSPQVKSTLVSVAADGKVFWESEPISLDAVIQKATHLRPDQGMLLIAADESRPYGEIAGLLERLRAAGVSSVSLALKGNKTP